MTIWPFSPAVNNRFVSGFPTAPVPNTSGSFVGAGYDFSAVGWNIVAMNGGRTQSFTMLSPVHAFNADHYGLSVGTNVQLLGASGNLVSQRYVAKRSVPTIPGFTTATHDISISTLSAPLSAGEGVTPMRVLDIASSNYVGQRAFAMGSTSFSVGQQIATSFIESSQWATSFFNLDDTSGNPAITFRGGQSGDSGSPVMIPYKGELTIAGSFWSSNAFGSLLPIVAHNYNPTPGVNAILAADGYALKWTIYDVPSDTANTASRWTGAGNGLLNSAGNWQGGAGFFDKPVVFDAAAATSLVTQTGGAQTLRGILFRSGTSTAGFQITGTDTLTIGSTGIRNESQGTHIFSTGIVLSDSQNWEAAGSGGLVFDGPITNNGKLLVVGGSGTVRINGVLSGTGGLARDDAGVLILSGSNTYTGKTFIHNGTIRTEANGALSSQSTVLFDV